MRILVCSHGSFDIYHPVSGPERRVPGGAFTSIAAMAQAVPDDTIVPLVTVGDDSADEVSAWCRNFPNVDAGAIIVTGEPTRLVHYYRRKSGTDVRCSSGLSAPIPYAMIRPKLQSADAILLAMNSGSDITLETLDEMRMELQSRSVPIHLDVHSLVLGPDEGRGRPYRPVPTWRRWFFNCTTVQLNEVEAAAITPDHMVEEHFVKQALALGLGGLLITRDERGMTLYREHHKKIAADEIAAEQTAEPGVIGCGDIVAGVFLARLARTHDVPAAARAAATVAGWMAASAPQTLFFDFRERLKEYPLP